MMKICKENKGVAIVLVVGVLVFFLLFFIVVGIDFVYIYYVRGEIQNAADSAALAGAAKLDGNNSIVQTGARNEAVMFAAKNSAAHSSVILASDGSNTFSNTNDITVGNWNPGLTPQYDDSGTRFPINAVKVVGRRTGDSPGGEVGLIFPNIVQGLTSIGMKRRATASLLPQAGQYFMICNDPDLCGSCTHPTNCIFDPPRIMDLQTQTPSSNRMAWTSLLDVPPSTPEFQSLICEDIPQQEVCYNDVQNFTGGSNDAMRALESAMYNPNFDRESKTIDVSNNVITWDVVVPVTKVCPPDDPQPMEVWGYARMTLTRVCAAGGGNVWECQPFYTATPGVCGGGDTEIAISSLSCADCDNKFDILGVRPSLVQ